MILPSDLLWSERPTPSYRRTVSTCPLSPETAVAVEEKPEVGFRYLGPPMSGPSSIVQRWQSASRYGQGTMTTRRTTGPQGHAVESALSPSGDASLPFYLEIFSGLPMGVVVLHLENPKDVRSFRIMDLNPATASLTGSTL